MDHETDELATLPKIADDLPPVGIATVCNGAVPELFAAELRKVIENMADPNTPALGKRRIVLQFDFSQVSERGESRVTVTAKTTLAAPNGDAATIYHGIRRVPGRGERREHAPDDARPEVRAAPQGRPRGFRGRAGREEAVRGRLARRAEEEPTMSTEQLDGGAVTEIRKLANVEGRDYSTTPLYDPRKADPEPAALRVSTLGALAGYALSGFDGRYIDGGYVARKAMVHVVSPSLVRIVTCIHGEFNQRVTLAEAHAVVPAVPVGRWLDQETANITLQALFFEDAERERARKIVAGLKEERAQDVLDDGLTQRASMRMGVSRTAEVSIANPFLLAPYRTFAEVEQPKSPFILRLRGGGDGKAPEVALFEADGGKWQIAATQLVAEFLRNALGSEFQIIH